MVRLYCLYLFPWQTDENGTNCIKTKKIFSFNIRALLLRLLDNDKLCMYGDSFQIVFSANDVSLTTL